jgi:hypothetical protein
MVPDYQLKGVHVKKSIIATTVLILLSLIYWQGTEYSEPVNDEQTNLDNQNIPTETDLQRPATDHTTGTMTPNKAKENRDEDFSEEEHARLEQEEALIQIQSLIADIMAENAGDRLQWLSQWPQPPNIHGQLMLLALSTEHVAYKDQSFDQVLDQAGRLNHVFPDSQVSPYLKKVSDRAEGREDFMVRAQIQKYNSRFGVDYDLTQEMLKDMKRLEDKTLPIDGPMAQSYFDALMDSSDIDLSDKYLSGINLVEAAPDELMGPMLERLETQVTPLINTDD